MKIVFLGTPEYVVPVVDKLHKEFRSKDGGGVVAVVTLAPKPAGRGQDLKYSEVDDWAHKKGVPKFFNPQELINKNIEADIGILAAYGQIIPKSVIDHFRFGILNVHPSDLPKYRGASPVQATILTEKIATVSIMKMDEDLDHGPIVSKFTEDIKSSDTSGALIERLFKRSAGVLAELLPAYVSGKIKPKAQDHKKSTFTTLLKKEHSFVPFEYLKGETEGKWKIPFVKGLETEPSPQFLHNFIRAMDPWPGAWTEVEIGGATKRLKLLGSELKDEKLVLKEVQLEGKNPVSWKQFVEAYPKNSL